MDREEIRKEAEGIFFKRENICENNLFEFVKGYLEGYKSLEAENKQLREECEKLKCCGNCAVDERISTNLDCLSCFRYVVSEKDDVDNWRPQEGNL